MKVETLMTKDVFTCNSSDTVERAAQIFWERDCGCVPVVDEDRRVVGMLTDRDICIAAYTRGKLLREIPVSATMSDTVLSCKPNDKISTAENVMQKNQIRRLPVVGTDGRLLGILSLHDLVHEAMQEHTKKRKELTDSEIGRTLGAICAPRRDSSARSISREVKRGAAVRSLE